MSLIHQKKKVYRIAWTIFLLRFCAALLSTYLSFIQYVSSAFDVSAYCVVAVESAGRTTPMAFLVRVKEDFMKRYGAGKAKTAAAKSLNKEFG